jgi:hypothetical protein
MEDRDEDFNINADRFGDSYARDTSIEELQEVSQDIQFARSIA